MSTRSDHANCAPGCNLHPELHHAGWIQSGTLRWHYFMPGMNRSECGLMRATDYAVRHPKIASAGCANCRKVIARDAIKLREAMEGNDDDR